MSKSKVVVLFSGGLDSTVLLWSLKETYEVRPLAFNYGQRHVKELLHMGGLAHLAGVEGGNVADISAINDLISVGSQAGREPVPEGHYAEESMKATIVPNRNMIMLAIATGYAIKCGAESIYFAAHAGDHAIYPDCRPDFVYALNKAIVIGNEWTPVQLFAPFVNLTKSDIVKIGHRLEVPMHLTWSCYAARDLQCGKCGTCVERREAFKLAEVPDYTDYEQAATA